MDKTVSVCGMECIERCIDIKVPFCELLDGILKYYDMDFIILSKLRKINDEFYLDLDTRCSFTDSPRNELVKISCESKEKYKTLDCVLSLYTTWRESNE